MKRGLLSVLIILSLVFLVSGSAIAPKINPQQSKSLKTGNNVCEYYERSFSKGETEDISMNGEKLDIGYMGEGVWTLNDYEGEIKNHDFFIYNENDDLKRVRFGFNMEGGSFDDGVFSLTEQDYYPWDCQGYSSSTGMVSEIKIKEGWNLVPFDGSLRECYYALEGELCKEDVLVSYIYLPSSNEYVREEDLQGEGLSSVVKSYFREENEFFLKKSSKWIYVKSGSGDKKIIGDFGAYIPYREQYLKNNNYQLKKGWNFLYVDAFMVYDDNWNENPMSFSEFSGNCEIKGAYLWDNFDKEWGEIKGEIDDDLIGQGMIVQVSNDCHLGYSDEITSFPEMPGDEKEIDDEELVDEEDESEGEEDENEDEGVWNNYVYEGDVEGLNYVETMEESSCDLLEGDCSAYTGVYEEEGGQEWGMRVEVYNQDISNEDLIENLDDRYSEEDIKGGDYVGNYYYIVYEEKGVKLYWNNDNKIISLAMAEELTEEREGYIEDIIKIYLNKYNSGISESDVAPWLGESCYDSDSGLSYKNRGSAWTNEEDKITDFCVDNIKLSEAICNNDGNPAYAQYDCENECVYGKCLEDNECILYETNNKSCNYNGVEYIIQNMGGCGVNPTNLLVSYNENIENITVMQGEQTTLNNGVVFKLNGAPCGMYITNIEFE